MFKKREEKRKKQEEMEESIRQLILFNVIYPNRDFEVTKKGDSYILKFNDKLGCNDYMLEGRYNYKQIKEFSKLTGGYTEFGYCPEIGPVAFIGLLTTDYNLEAGYFFPEVNTYGIRPKGKDVRVEKYSLDDAEHIANFTVYGQGNPRMLQNAAPISKVKYTYDYRYIYAKYFKERFGVMPMQIKIDGYYDYIGAKAFSSMGQFNQTLREDTPIQFAIVDEKEPVGILGLSKPFDNVLFRDVWGPNEEEPEGKSIRFISDLEAQQINKFKLYYFITPQYLGTEHYVPEKIDRTLYKDYNYIMEDGVDYRLQTLPKEEQVVRKLV